ncbi:MAG: hypothetical protein Q9188_001184 [Gyalolechia gomerana]
MIRTIDATYALCIGQRPKVDSRIRAYPVYRIRKDLSIIPATRSDYRVLQKLKDRTRARDIVARFRKAVSLPGHSRPVSCILVKRKIPGQPHEILRGCSFGIRDILRKKKWTYHGEEIRIVETGAQRCKLKFSDSSKKESMEVEGDGSLTFSKHKFPFLVLEACDSQHNEKFEKKISYWIKGSKGHLKLLCVLHKEGRPNGYRVLADVIRPAEVGVQGNYTSMRQYIHQMVEIYPRQPQESFDIFLDDVLPKQLERDSVSQAEYATVSLNIFHEAARDVADTAEARATTSGDSSPADPNQRDAPSTPSSSGDEAGVGAQAATINYDDDSDYEPETDHSEGEEPYTMAQ